MSLCPSCSHENQIGAKFCSKCGVSLEEAASTAQEMRKIVTVLFCDVVGFTTLGEHSDPEPVRQLMGRYFAEMRKIVERHGGIVEKFIGDAVMAVFGIPQSHEDDALRAVRAAAEMQAAVEPLKLEIGIGINTGEVVTGSGETFATGDAVNVAARLEQATSPGEILIGTETLGLVRDVVRVEAIDPLELKGKEEQVEAHRLVAVAPGAPSVSWHLDPPMVGRQRELERLRADFEHAVSDSACHLFTLLGPAGVGKSRLVRAFVEGVAHDSSSLRSASWISAGEPLITDSGSKESCISTSTSGQYTVRASSVAAACPTGRESRISGAGRKASEVYEQNPSSIDLSQ
jgi:class 3 adenylate cyclase